ISPASRHMPGPFEHGASTMPSQAHRPNLLANVTLEHVHSPGISRATIETGRKTDALHYVNCCTHERIEHTPIGKLGMFQAIAIRENHLFADSLDHILFFAA